MYDRLKVGARLMNRSETLRRKDMAKACTHIFVGSTWILMIIDSQQVQDRAGVKMLNETVRLLPQQVCPLFGARLHQGRIMMNVYAAGEKKESE